MSKKCTLVRVTVDGVQQPPVVCQNAASVELYLYGIACRNWCDDSCGPMPTSRKTLIAQFFNNKYNCSVTREEVACRTQEELSKEAEKAERAAAREQRRMAASRSLTV